MIRNTIRNYIAGILICCVAVFTIPGCSDGEDVCSIDNFIGVYIGQFSLGIITTPDVDTITITVNEVTNKVMFTSALLGGAGFEATYDPQTGRAEIEAVEVETFDLGALGQMTGVSIGGGHAELDMDCDGLYLQFDNVNIEDHPFPAPTPKPLAVEVISSDMDRL